jgi:hypothetical protein
MIEFINVAHAGVISDAPSLSNIGLKILSFLLSVFSVIAIIMSVVSGAKYFLSFGDKRDLKDAKKSIKNVVIGIIVALSSFVLVKLISSIISG